MNQRSIIFEETVKIQHTENCKNLDDCIEAINEVVEVCQVDENWAEDSDDFEYYDDYPTELDN